MKKLDTYISHVKTLHSLNEFIKESFNFRINRDSAKGTQSLSPTTWEELRQIIEDRYKELGPGTAKEPIDFNDIDIREIESFYNEQKYLGVFEYTEFEYIDISNWDVSNVKDMTRMFKNCSKLKSVGDLSKWNVSNVEYLKAMFRYCHKLEFVGDLSNWNVSNVKRMSLMFEDCYELTSVGDLSGWDVRNVEYMTDMFTTSGIKNRPDWYKY